MIYPIGRAANGYPVREYRSAIIMFLMEKENMSYDDINNYLNKESGVLGISGISSDFRDLMLRQEKVMKGHKLHCMFLRIR